MKRILTFSPLFPSHHPAARTKTFFIEKGWSGLAEQDYVMDGIDLTHVDFNFDAYYSGTPKWHTVRNGQRFKPGDIIRPCVWKLKGGRFTKGNTLIQFAPDIEVKKTWSFRINRAGNYFIGKNKLTLEQLKRVAKNDGFDNADDFECWFPKKVFAGQIICWNDKIQY